MNKRGDHRFKIKYHPLVVQHDIPTLDTLWRERIQRAIQEKLATQPEIFGRPLRKSLKGYRKLRVGDYRIVFKIDGFIIFILLIKHRSVVYEKMVTRHI